MSRKARITNLLQTQFAPLWLDVQDESANHSAGVETHYRVVVVSAHFEGVNRITRHRMINSVLAEERNHGMHALALFPWSPVEWSCKEQTTPDSPSCRGGSKQG